MSAPHRSGVLRPGAKYAVGGLAGGLLLDALLGSARIQAVNTEAYEPYFRQGRAVIFALWHGRLLPPTYRHRRTGIVTLASQSGDGEYITRVLQHWGFHVVRGSSSRGGDTALRELIRLARAGRSIALTSDGPRGPREKLKPGVLQIAQLTGAPLVPVDCGMDRAWRFQSWDRFVLPKPFARIRIVYGDPVFIPRHTAPAELGTWAERIESRLAALRREAEAAA